MFNLPSHKNKIFASAILLLVCIFGLLKGAQAPGIWGFSHYLFDYSFGFMRRGFVGGVGGYIFGGAVKSYHYYFYLSLILLLANYCLLFILALRVLGTGLKNSFVIAIFFANPALLYFDLFIGYGEYWGLLVTLISLFVKNFWSRFIVILIGSMITILIHEANFIIFFPIQLLSLLLITQSADRKKLVAIFTLSLFLTLFFLFVGFNSLTPENALGMYQYIKSDLGFSVGKQNVLFLSDGLGWSFHNMLSLVGKNPLLIALFFLSIFVFSPTIISSVRGCYLSIEALFQRSPVCIPMRLLKVLTLLAPFSSLILILVAWDFIRWVSLVVVCSFVLYLVFMDAMNIKAGGQTQSHPPTKRWIVFNSCILVFYLWFVPPIMGTEQSFSSFPFLNHAESVKYLFENWDDVQYNLKQSK